MLAASLAKTHQLWTEGMGEPTLGSWGFVALIELEFAVGLGLASNLWPRVLRGIALALFAAFVGLLLSRAAAGERSCLCAGNLEISVHLMIFVDLCVLIGLWRWHPVVRPCSRSVKMGLPAVLLLLAPWPLLAAFRPAPYPRLIAPASTDVGRVGSGERRTVSIRLRNPHGKLVEVVAIESSCPCVTGNGVPVRVPAGEGRALTLTLDFSREPEFTGPLALELKGRTAEGTLALLTRLMAHVEKTHTSGRISESKSPTFVLSKLLLYGDGDSGSKVRRDEEHGDKNRDHGRAENCFARVPPGLAGQSPWREGP